MILHSVHVENYKGIRGPWHVEFDPQSPNLLEGPNGIGKSTLVEAMERCLVESHHTSGASAEEMRPRGTALAPVITVEFSHAGADYRIAKTFLDSPKAILERKRADGVWDTIAKGKAADELVREMLRSQPTKAKDKPGDRMGLFSVLCSLQGKQDLPALSGDALADIRGMLGAQVSGAGGAAFERLVNKKYLSVWTPGAKPKKGKLTESQEALEKAQEDLAKCVALMGQVAELESSGREQRSLSQETQAVLRLALAQHDPLEAIAQEVLALRGRRVPAVSRLEAVTARYNQMRAEIDRIIECNKKKRSCEEERPRLQKEAADAKQLRDTQVHQAAAAQQAWELACGPAPELLQMEERIESAAAFVSLGSELEAIGVRLERARGAAKLQATLEAEIAALNAPALSTWKEIQSVGRDLDEARLRVEALALRLEIVAEAELTANVIAGDPAGEVHLAAGQTFSASGDGALTVAMPGVATFRVTGPSGNAGEWRAKQEKAGTRLCEMLEPFGVSAWQKLENRVNHRERIAPDLLGAKAEYAAALENDALDELEDRRSKMAAEREELLGMEPSWAEKLPDVVALRAEASALKAQRENAQNTARAEWQNAERLCAGAESLAATTANACSANETALAEAKGVLAALEADALTISERQEKLADRRRECETAEGAIRDIDKALGQFPADAPESASAIREQIAKLEDAIQKAREAYQQNEAAARAILLQGPYTSLASAEERLRQLEHDIAVETLRLEAIKRLKTAVDDAKAKALAGIAEPVEVRATALLERISGRPLARVQLGDGMALRAIEPEGCSGEAPVDQMSAGEQEQIYFATRLALAEVLSEKERQVLVLDDPLVNTDANRLARAVELIAEESERLQFVILTCHPGRYIELPKAVSRSMDHLTPTLAGAGEAQS
jgi:energy-coupling factor transporter ATP-binding protein EcfA2